MGYQTKNYREQGGDKQVVLDGGEIELRNGATLDCQAGSNVLFGTMPTWPAQAVAAAGNNQATAAALATGINKVTGADGAKGTRLPAAAAGKPVLLANTVSNQNLNVFPAAGDKINGGNADAALVVAGGKNVLFFCFDDTDWYAIVTA